MNQNIAHGKVEGRWCDECGTLVLGKKCSSCGFEGRAFEMNSPGDIRPCMGDSIESVMSLFRNTFGTADPLKGRMIFFNKIPGEDRTDEIIAHGEVISVIRFDPRDRKLHLDLRQAGADIFAEKAAKNIVEIKGVSGHLKGKVVRGEDISEITGDFTAGDP
ncbi:MAG: reductase, partial [Methanomassiliicoccaceae archaeon]|nr:reductase [Methanomassiliicoccaceae archaeon]